MINTAWGKLKTKQREKTEWNTTTLTAMLFNFGLEILTHAIRQVKEIHKG